MNVKEAYRQPGHPAAFSGRAQLARHFPQANVKEVLSSIDSYTRHRQAKKPRHRNPIYIYNTRELLQIDLADVRSLGDKNKLNNTEVRFLLLAIDTFSRKAWARPLINKSAPVVAAGMRSILREIHQPIKKVFSDAGKEFKNSDFKALLKKFKIKEHLISSDQVKCAHIERFVGSLKKIMHMYMTEYETGGRYLDQLDQLMESYNNRLHRSINMTPNEADKPENRNSVIDFVNRTRYGPIAQRRSKKGPEFKVGDTVRLKIHGPTFRKGHEPSFTGEMFRVRSILDSLPITQYQVESYDGDEVVRGAFYASELQLTTSPVFKIEKVIARRKTKIGKVQLKVKWLHFSDKHNSWINQSDIEEEYDNE
jgi:transposase InsO family protein